MSPRPILNAFCIVALVFGTSKGVRADISNLVFNGDVTADFDGTVDSDTSSAQPGALIVTASGNNSQTQTDVDWSWDGTSLTGSSQGTAEKTVSARPGGDHTSSSVFSFSFDIDADSTFQLTGLWGTNNLSGTDDSLTYLFTGPSGTVTTATSGGTSGVTSESISSSGIITPGSYTLTFTSTLSETINNQQTGVNARVSGWAISEFSIVPVAVPEPSAALPVLLAIFSHLAIRRRSNKDA